MSGFAARFAGAAVLATLLLLRVPGAAAVRPARLLASFPVGGAIVESSRHNCLHIRTWFARTPEQRARGLMFVEALDDFEGMLFRYREPGVINMWMKNTLIPLDMVFFAGDGRVMHIAHHTTPRSTRRISSGGEAIAVLELPGGFARRRGIETGDSRLLWAGPDAFSGGGSPTSGRR